jgi:hypothetical protein
VWVGVLFGPRKRLGREVGEATTRKSDNGESMVMVWDTWKNEVYV